MSIQKQVINKQPKNAAIEKYAQLAQSLAIDVALFKAWFGELPPDLVKNLQTRLDKGPVMPTPAAANQYIKQCIQDAVADEKFKLATQEPVEDNGGEE